MMHDTMNMMGGMGWMMGLVWLLLVLVILRTHFRKIAKTFF